MKLFRSLQKFGANPDNIYNYKEKSKDFSIEGHKANVWVYAHAVIKIGQLKKLEVDLGGGEVKNFKEITEKIVKYILTHFAESYFNAEGNGQKVKIENLSKVIFVRFQNRLSIFGLLHCLDLLAWDQEPCQKIKLFGFDPKGVLKAIEKYLAYLEIKSQEFYESINPKPIESMAALNGVIAKTLAENPEMQEKFSYLIRRGEEEEEKKQQRIDRGAAFVQKAKDEFYENLIEVTDRSKIQAYKGNELNFEEAEIENDEEI